MSEPRIIKKYPNRRLYDTELSKYITLEDVRRLVRDGVDFVVRGLRFNRLNLARAVFKMLI